MSTHTINLDSINPFDPMKEPFHFPKIKKSFTRSSYNHENAKNLCNTPKFKRYCFPE